MLDLPVGHRGKPCEHVAQVGVGIDAAAAATLDNGVEYRAEDPFGESKSGSCLPTTSRLSQS